MKTLFKIALMLTIPFLGLVSCEKDEIILETALDVIPAYIEGVWKLAEINNEAVSEDTYVYMVLSRKETKFEIYSNINSMYTTLETGKYTIKKDEDNVSTISGKYNFGKGNWNNTYVVTELFKESMIWTAEGDDSDVSKYIRCEEVPADILADANR